MVDREFITGLPDGAAANCLAVYHVDAAGHIARAQFVWEPFAPPSSGVAAPAPVRRVNAGPNFPEEGVQTRKW